MACGTVVGDALEFGVSDDEASLTTQSVSITRKIDKTEARDKCGIIVAVAYYNPTADVTIDGLGTSAGVLGALLTLNGSFGLGAGNIYIEEVSVDKANEEFVSSSVKAMQFSGITV